MLGVCVVCVRARYAHTHTHTLGSAAGPSDSIILHDIIACRSKLKSTQHTLTERHRVAPATWLAFLNILLASSFVFKGRNPLCLKDRCPLSLGVCEGKLSISKFVLSAKPTDLSFVAGVLTHRARSNSLQSMYMYMV